MNAPKKPMSAKKEEVDLSQEKPVVGTQNYKRKFTQPEDNAYAAPGMPISVKKKKVSPKTNNGYLAMYRGGAKNIGTGDREMAEPSVKDTQDPPPYLSPEDSDPDLSTEKLVLPQSTSPTVQATRSKMAQLPAERDSGKRTPKDYKEAAAVIRSDKGLYAQYKAGIASGKAFSLSVGGKTFKYAATPQATKEQQAYATAVGQYDGQGDAYEEYRDNMPKGPTRAAALGKAASDLVDAKQTPLPKRMKARKG